ncbi:MAG TPA: polysaccharide deacetylase family protein [Candidatus Saccharimonadales bacterium]|jgi:peptidoglycan/xylan/chitin deacetylase (PgdA/CDA1 family)
MSLIVAVCVAAGIGSNVQYHRELIAQAKVDARRQAEAEAVAEARARASAATYSWVSPVNCKLQPCIALTFDDGPDMYTTPQVLSILEREHVHASFFIVGSRVAGNQALLRRMFADGDEIGDHSWTHPDFTTLKPAQIRQQIAFTQKAIHAAGVPAPTLFRPPYGAVDQKVISNVPLTFMFWNEDPEDWAADSPKQVEKAVIASAKPGGVVDMHDIYHVTAESLDPIIKKLKAEHYQFVTVSQLLGLQPGQKGEFYGRP